MGITFEIHQVSSTNRHVRNGVLHTDDGNIQTPTVVPYGRNGLVSPLTSNELVQTGCQALAIDALPLSIRPGKKALQSSTTVRDFLDWSRPVISFVDHFPVMEKVKKNAGQLGVRYREPYTGAHKRITGDQAHQLQKKLRATVQLPLFQNADYYAPVDDLQTAVQLNAQWQEQSHSEWGVITGAGLKQLRQSSYQQIGNKKGYLITNLPDNDSMEWQRIVNEVVNLLPNDQPRMIVATSNEQISLALLAGVDMIISAVPIDMAHQGLTYSADGIKKISQEQYQADQQPIIINDQNQVSLSYLHYLNHLHSPLGDHLLGLRNWQWLNSYMNALRSNINVLQEKLGDDQVLDQ